MQSGDAGNNQRSLILSLFGGSPKSELRVAEHCNFYAKIAIIPVMGRIPFESVNSVRFHPRYCSLSLPRQRSFR